MNRIVTRLKTLNSALPGLLAGILLYAVPTELIGLLLVPDKRRYTVGLLSGIALACYMAVHMANGEASEGHRCFACDSSIWGCCSSFFCDRVF